MLDGGLAAVHGVVDELDSLDINGVDAGSRGLLRPEGEGEHNAFADHRVIGHQNAEAYAAFDGLAVENDHCAVVGRSGEDLAVFSGN